MFFKAYTKLEAVFSINENRHAIKHKLNYEITKDTNKMDFRYMQTDHARILKRAFKQKENVPSQLKAGKIKTSI